MKKQLHLFEAYGIELEYMIVDRDSLNVMPIADKLIEHFSGEISDDFDMGSVTISNELVLHVIELKCSIPHHDLVKMEAEFNESIKIINEVLKNKWNARLMPGATHPWMNPARETILWPHGNSAIYERYNSIFNCRGHGWSNLQSVHINLPFYGDKEFSLLHNSARILLPIIPALSASSPIMEGKFTGSHDKRLVYYKNNQKRIPSICGDVIPEVLESKKDYENKVYNVIKEDIAEFNEDGILDPVWVNSRGVMDRFDRNSIEIRILDLQECPGMDLAIATLVVNSIRLFAEGKLSTMENITEIDNKPLVKIFDKVIKESSQAVIDDGRFLSLFGIRAEQLPVLELWRVLFDLCKKEYPGEMKHWNERIEYLLSNGSLAQRLVEVANGIYTKSNLKLIYQELSQNLEENKAFKPCQDYIL